VVGDLLPALALTGCGVYGALPALRERLRLSLAAAPLHAIGVAWLAGTLLIALVHLGFGQARWF
jgi:hypothetical protein